MSTLLLMVSAGVTACGTAVDPGGSASDAANGSAPGPSGNSPGVTGVTGGPGVTGVTGGTAAEPHSSAVPPGVPATPTDVPPSVPGGIRDPAFAATSTAMRQRVGSSGGSGYLLVVQDGAVVHEEGFGGATRQTAVPVASTAKWLTAAVVMTLVDEGRLSLDDALHEHLPEFGDGDERRITVRQMLDHTSGIRDQPCLWNAYGSMDACVASLASAPLQFPPGTAFSYGNASFHVAGKLVEELTGTDFVSAFQDRIGEPLGFTGTTWPGAGANPSPAAGVTISVEDVARMLAMMQAGGTFRGRRVLSEASIAEMTADQVRDFDTSGDYSVGITGIPRYGLGLWIDVVDPDHRTRVFSANGANGEYPWIDLEHGVYGIVAVYDQRGAQLAVPASQAVVEEALADTARR